MYRQTRRALIKTALASTAALGAGAAIHGAAHAAAEFKDVKFPQDPANLQPGLEAAHTPAIRLEKVESGAVAYGKTPMGDFYRVSVQARHEATKEHHIDAIALYLNGALVAEHTMTHAEPGVTLPLVSVAQRLKRGDELVAVTTCNLHGKWGRTVSVETALS
jgi:desulfoferrodoxin (superoxide reductase-like protein)